ncbi:MAG: PAS domain S-box protein [Pseudomonadota bacterium]
MLLKEINAEPVVHRWKNFEFVQSAKSSGMAKGIAVFSLLFALLFIWWPEPSLGAGNTYKVGILQNPPKVFLSEAGEPRGIYVDLLDSIAKKEGWQIQYVPCTWNECLQAVERGELDLLVDVGYSPERSRRFVFNKEPVLRNWAEVFMRDGEEARSPLDLNGKTIVVLKGGIHGKNFESLLKSLGVNYRLHEVKSYEGAFRAVAAHEADAAVVNNLFGLNNAKKYGLYSSHIIFSPVDLHIITRKDGPANALETIDKYLKAWIPDKGSVYHQTLTKWLYKRDHWEIPLWVYWALAFVAALLVILGGAVAVSRRSIRSGIKQLSESEARYRTLFDKSGDTIFIHDLSGRFLDVNQEACDRLGYSKDEMLQMSVADIEAPAFAAIVPKRIRSIEAEGELIFEAEHVTKQGEVVPVEIMSTFVTYNKQPIVFNAARDLRERIKAQEERNYAQTALSESEERYRALFERSPELVYLCDFEGNFIDANNAALELLGYTKDEITALNFGSLLDKDQLPLAFKTAEDILETGSQEEVAEYKLRQKDGEYVYVESMGAIIYRDGKPFAIQGIARDITERKRSEEERLKLETQLQQSQKMEGIGRLAGGIAHDFNNLLTTIIGYTDIMLMKIDKGSSLRTGMEEIKKASDRAANLTSQLLAFSRKQMIQPVVLDLNYPLTEMDKMLRRLIGEDIDLITVLEPELWKVKFDPGQMDQVVMNLAVNAKDAMPEGGKLTIETANVDLDEAYARQHGVEMKPGPFVLVSVSDTGMGMDDETRSHIFEPFFTTKEKGKGTGLGLSTVYGIIKQSEGFIWVYSEPGQGTTFKIYLPAIVPHSETQARRAGLPKAEAEEAFAEEEQTQPQNLEGSEAILLAEEDDSLRELVRSILQEHGYRVLEAQDGEEALQLFEQHEGPIHLLLTDVVMPGMDGRELAERLQLLHPKMKVLYMSGYTDHAIVRNGVLEPGMPFIQKPFAPEVLVSKCRKVLDT